MSKMRDVTLGGRDGDKARTTVEKQKRMTVRGDDDRQTEGRHVQITANRGDEEEKARSEEHTLNSSH